ncbi:alpha/beta hydrolase-fold protein [Aureisphaera galaxeae]|uniref:alpha/beta hydrolase-fold protein n=1 Tax=Aureisphaera galaxeae TaxID=1538023 RepID=UPI002350EE50|nr:alpha/beta hydrolase-fold protein [Aureisphaera galaxeae]MDC8003923.1 alpha/beta hydrolase-fold protein [Aureisphaera galaxeae]
MKLRILMVAFISLLSLTAVCQPKERDNIVGRTITLPSEVLAEEREIQVYLPNGYSENESEYPVLYVLDGQRYFLHAVSLQQSMTGFRQTPEFIVVGISKSPSERNRNFSSNAQNFLSFIDKELISYIDTRYRSSQERLLFGWGFAGGFTIQSMVDKPQLFDAYIAASPFPVTKKVAAVDSLLSKDTSFDKLLYFSSDINEGSVKEGTALLHELLLQKAPETMPWKFREFEGEEHRSTPYATLYHGLRNYFQYYPELQFSNLEAFLEAGGLQYVYDYYEKRASRYGFPEELSDWTMFSITRNAIRADDFQQFERFVNEFQSTGFIDRLRVSRASLIAEFYLKNERFEKARDFFSDILKKSPNAVRTLQGLGDAYKGMKQDEKAVEFYEKAKSLLEKKGN